MPDAQSTAILTVYAPALMSDDGRPLAVVRAMERAFPGLRLEWTISDEGRLVPLPQRDAWIARGRADGPGFPLVCNGGDAKFRVTISGWERPAEISPGGLAQFEVHVKFPLDAADIAVAADILEGVAEEARAFWGHVTPTLVASEMAQQVRHSAHRPHVPPRGLPTLKLTEDIPSPAIPHGLGWLNYWSAAAAQAIGFPDSSRDADLLSRARRTATGGWVVWLTEVPLELDNPAHLDTLRRAYERFPAIGGRSAPHD